MRFVAIAETVAMNKYVLNFLFLFLSVNTVAQSVGKFDIYTGVGKSTVRDLLSGWYNPDRIDIYGAESYRHIHPVWIAGVNYHASRFVTLGICVARHSYEEAYFNKAAWRQFYSSYDATSICAEIKVVLYEAQLFQIYTGASAGCFHEKGTNIYSEINTSSPNPEKQDYITNLPAIYLNAAGFRFGRKLGAYMELGIGYKGLINGGLSILLGKGNGKMGGFR